MECVVCGRSYEGRPSSRYCSRTCVLVVGRATVAAHNPQDEVLCPHCERTFKVGGRAGKKRGAQFCSDPCRVGYRRAHPPKPIRQERVCVACGTTFLVGGKSGPKLATRFCSAVCRHRSHYIKGVECRTLTVPEAAYIAGFWDGEGSIFLIPRANGSFGLLVTVTNTDRAVMDWVTEVTGVGRSFAREQHNPKHKPTFWWQASGDAALTFLRQIEPYMRVKRTQAHIGIDFQQRLQEPTLKSDRSWQAEYRSRIQDLNRRGPR